MEGKEVRFGIANSALFATVTTDASCGAVNSMHDSFTPLGGLVPLVNIQLGEVIFGGVGAGLYGMLVMVVLTVFIAGLMVGRTPEYLGKKVEGREMKLAMLYVLVFPLMILAMTAWASVVPYGTSSHRTTPGRTGSRRSSTSTRARRGNNGSAFGGLNGNTPFFNLTGGVTMLVGRFFMIIPALAIAGSMVGKKTVPAGPGHLPHHRAHLRGAPHLGDRHRRRAHVLPRALPVARARALLLAPREGVLAMTTKAKPLSLLDPGPPPAGSPGQPPEARPAAGGQEPGDVRGGGGERPHHPALAAGPPGPAGGRRARGGSPWR